MKKAEDAEQSLSYFSPYGSEASRKKTGSYYTPVDVSLFFWQEFLLLNRVKDETRIRDLWNRHHFIEPSAGAGALIFALLQQGVFLGLSLDDLSKTYLTIIDINQTALYFIKEQLTWLENCWGISFYNIRYICSDFRTCKIPVSSLDPLFFGNPPFVSNPKGSEWKNLFADFLSRAIQQMGPNGKCHFILPVSVAFSGDYSRLRKALRETGKSVAISSFDNIPDTLFPSGKPKHTNTNKANSQRCSILTVLSEEKQSIISTKMHRWSKTQRKQILTRTPHYHDVTSYDLDDQFPRPESDLILRYISESTNAIQFKSLLSDHGNHSLFISKVARNFIGFREEAASGAHHLRFETKKTMCLAILILSSDLFLAYWRTIGDGFHLTRRNIVGFPLHRGLMTVLNRKTIKGLHIWENRVNFAKEKRYPGGATISYDFSEVAFPALSIFQEYIRAK